MSGDVSLAANIAYPDAAGYGNRKAVLINRHDLDDDSREAMVALHGAGMVHIWTTPCSGVSTEQQLRPGCSPDLVRLAAPSLRPLGKR
jgi:hypothetical protein